MMSSGSGPRSLSFLDKRLQQELQNAMDYAKHNAHLRIQKIGCVRGEMHGRRAVAMQIKFSSARSLSSAYSTTHAVEVAIRLPNEFPIAEPMLSCTSGFEHLPDILQYNGHLHVPWLEDGWSPPYNLTDFLEDMASAMQKSLPSALDQENPSQQLTPSAPNYYTINHSDALVVILKWKDEQARLRIDRKTMSISILRSKAKIIFREIPKEITLQEFHSSDTGVFIKTDKDVNDLVAKLPVSMPLCLFIIEATEELTSVKPINVDLLDLNSLQQELSHGTNANGLIDRAYGLIAAPVHPSTDAINKTLQKSVCQLPAESIQLKNLLKTRNIRQMSKSEFAVEQCVGAGTSLVRSCQVYKAKWRGTDIALKTFMSQGNTTAEREFVNEVTMHTSLGSHPSLVLFFGICMEPMAIALEYLPYSLFDLIQNAHQADQRLASISTSWTLRAKMMLDAAQGLAFLHSFNIIHRDLKSLNLLVTSEGRVKLADFGISRKAASLGPGFMTGCRGTLQWMAPEVMQSQAYTVAADIYSLGVILWEISECSSPFSGVSPAMIPIIVLQHRKRPSFTRSTPPMIRDLIQDCWSQDATKRPSASFVASRLEAFAALIPTNTM